MKNLINKYRKQVEKTEKDIVLWTEALERETDMEKSMKYMQGVGESKGRLFTLLEILKDLTGDD